MHHGAASPSREIRETAVNQQIAHGIAPVPEERKNNGLFQIMSIRACC
ncbi:hypothetical protein [Pseudooceanicola spongiae]|nr:hypothetical protein [Pseudooceanicola spongiae]